MNRLVAIQLTSGCVLRDNLKAAEQQLAAAAAGDSMGLKGALVLLPENFAYYGPADGYRQHAEWPGEGAVQTWLATQARRYQCWLVAGSLPLLAPGDSRVYTASLAYSPAGDCLADYRKLHLFDANVADEQGCYRESDTFLPGQTIQQFETDFARVGLAICYDLRFPELFRWHRQAGADILLLPAAFTHLTGEAHWQALLQARAIENQCYMLAANQGGWHTHYDSNQPANTAEPSGEQRLQRRSWGHSMVIDPWGTIIAEAAQAPGWVSGHFEQAHMTAIRERMPLEQHAKLTVRWRENSEITDEI